MAWSLVSWIFHFIFVFSYFHRLNDKPDERKEKILGSFSNNDGDDGDDVL